MFSKRNLWVLLLLALALASEACVTYTGVAKDDKGQVYLVGETTFLIFGQSWVKRCEEIGKELVCERIGVSDGTIPGVSDGTIPDVADGTISDDPSDEPSTDGVPR